jgi:predicted PurR-regulated permease PerM
MKFFILEILSRFVDSARGGNLRKVVKYLFVIGLVFGILLLCLLVALILLITRIFNSHISPAKQTDIQNLEKRVEYMEQMINNHHTRISELENSKTLN